MARPPYHIARQQHLGDALDDLQARGRLTWEWDYRDRRAIYWVAEHPATVPRRLDTRQAEDLVQEHYDALGEPWRPVPHPGGESQRLVVMQWIARERARVSNL
jgi:hypothetical protein